VASPRRLVPWAVRFGSMFAVKRALNSWNALNYILPAWGGTILFFGCAPRNLNYPALSSSALSDFGRCRALLDDAWYATEAHNGSNVREYSLTGVSGQVHLPLRGADDVPLRDRGDAAPAVRGPHGADVGDRGGGLLRQGVRLSSLSLLLRF
jgi:hypothetical protein